jgi:glycosyltransferase involved in cell wall biosynthesis
VNLAEYFVLKNPFFGVRAWRKAPGRLLARIFAAASCRTPEDVYSPPKGRNEVTQKVEIHPRGIPGPVDLHCSLIAAIISANPESGWFGLETHAIVVPTYNERENIALLVESIAGLGLGSHLIVVDDNSPDGTGPILDELALGFPTLEVIHRPGKLGLGTAHIAGIQLALSQGAGQIVTMDADFSHHPRYIPDILAGLNQYDVVIGSRYVPGGDTRYCTAPRKALSRGANLFARTVLGLQAGDATAGFRGYRRAVLESIDLGAIVSDGYSFLIEMLYRCQRQGWQVGEVPIVFENRQRGASKISKTEILKAFHTVGRLGWERVFCRKNAIRG